MARPWEGSGRLGVRKAWLKGACVNPSRSGSLVLYEGGYLLPNLRLALFDGVAPLLADVLGEFGVKADHRARA